MQGNLEMNAGSLEQISDVGHRKRITISGRDAQRPYGVIGLDHVCPKPR